MNKKLFVGGLPYKVTDERLEEVFSVHGSVDSARVVTDKYTGESRGFGFVEMSTPTEATAAAEGLNETELDGRRITVEVARPREERSRW